jgi:hypothetical protein
VRKKVTSAKRPKPIGTGKRTEDKGVQAYEHKEELAAGASQREFAVSTELAARERKLVVILGAGASHGAREHPAPPLGKDLLDYLERYLHFIEEEAVRNDSGLPFREGGELGKLRHLLNNANERRWTYEHLVDHEVGKGHPHNENLSLLNRLLVAAFSPPSASYNPPIRWLDQAFFDRQDLYDEFLSHLKAKGFSSEGLTFITLNYDTLLEQAIRRTGGAFDYLLPGMPRKRGHVFLKIHGSINWCGKFDLSRTSLEGSDVPVDLAFVGQGRRYKNIQIEEDPYEACISADAGEPIIAHYAQGKPAYVNAETLAGVRKEAISECSAATEALIIGVHPPLSSQEDETLWQMIECLIGRQVPTRYVGRPPDTDTVAEKWQFQPVPKTFRDFVAQDLREGQLWEDRYSQTAGKINRSA